MTRWLAAACALYVVAGPAPAVRAQAAPEAHDASRNAIDAADRAVADHVQRDGRHAKVTLEAELELARLLSESGDVPRATTLYASLTGDGAVPGHSMLRARIVLAAGSYLAERRDPAHARPLLVEALALGKELADPRFEFEATRWLGDLALDAADFGGAQTYAGHALALAEHELAGDPVALELALYDEANLLEVGSGTQNADWLATAHALAERLVDLVEQNAADGPLDQARQLLLLARIERKQQDFVAADRTATRAYRIANAYAGPSHPRTSNAVTELRLIAALRHDRDGVVRWGALFEDALDDYYARVVLAGSEQQRLQFGLVIEQTTGAIVSLDATQGGDDALHRQAFLHLVRLRGRVLDAVAASPRTSPVLASARAALSEVALRGPRGDDAGWQAELARREAAVDAIEQREVAAGDADVGAPGESRRVTIDALVHALPRDGALVELVRYAPLDPQAGPIDAHGMPSYRAYVLRGDGALASIGLGPAAMIDGAATAFRAAIAARADVATPGRMLDRLTLEKLAPQLAGVHQLLVVPDGSLTAIPFDALVDPGGASRVDDYEIGVLASGRDLLARAPAPSRGAAVIVAHPAYGPSDGTGALAGVEFDDLPGTAAEAAAVAAQLPGATVVDGDRATESFVKGLHGPRVLHVATHGFFLDSRDVVATGTRGLVRVDASAATEVTPTAAASPMLRAGLALAGANHPRGGGDDGILTGLEAAGLDLRGTRLVVLSACETGVGEASSGEGVFGLRRAFLEAGAAQLVMSLWDVDDAATQALMSAFYKHLAAGNTVTAALRAARRELKADPRWAHPFYWAAFVASGRPTTLDGRTGGPPTVRGCSCGASGGAGGGWLVAAVVVALRRRRATRVRAIRTVEPSCRPWSATSRPSGSTTARRS